MASWDQLKANLQNQKTELDNRTTNAIIDQKVENMNAAIFRFVNNAGISQNPGSNADYTTANTIFNEITGLQKDYITLNMRLSGAVRQMTSAADVQNKLQQVGTIRNDIINLEKELKNVKQDADTSLARQGDIERPAQEVSFYQGIGAKLGFTKPLHLISVSVMISFGILLLFLSGLMLRDFFSPSAGAANLYSGYNSVGTGVFSLFTDSRAYSVLAGIVLVFTVVGILSVKGVLGTTTK
jgi:hypothetical protein